jgi:hypothetical protein
MIAGILFFFLVLGLGFWVLIFLTAFALPLWITVYQVKKRKEPYLETPGV